MNNKNITLVLEYAIYLLVALTLFIPIIGPTSGSLSLNPIIGFANMFFFPFITSKAFVFRILVEAAFGAWVVLACKDPRFRPRISPLFISVTVFTVVALIVDLLGFNPLRSISSNFERMEGWIAIIHCWMFFVTLASTLRTKVAWRRFFTVSIFGGIAVLIWAFAQERGVAQIHQSADRLDASLGNAEYLAVYMLYQTFIALYLGVLAWMDKRPRGFLYLVLAALFSVIILLTQTRGTVLAVVGAVAVTLIFITIFEKGKEYSDKLVRYISAGALILVFALVASFYSIRNTSFVQSHPALQRIASISLENPRIQYIWPMAWKGFQERPIIGWGQENFNYIFNKYYDPHMWGQEQWFDRAHNVFIDWAVAGGIVGLISYLALYVFGITAIWKSNFSVKEKALLIGLVFGYAIHNMFVFDNLVSYIMFFSLLAFIDTTRALNTDANKAQKGQKDLKDQKAPLKIDEEVVDWIIAPVVLIAFATGIYFVNIRPIMANIRLIDALGACSHAQTADVKKFENALNLNVYMANQEIREQLYTCTENLIGSQATDPQVKFNFYQLTLTTFKDQQAATPHDLRGYLFAASFLNGVGQWDLAKTYLDTAYKLSPVKQSVLYELAANAYGKNDPKLALKYMKTAYTESTDNPDAQSAYTSSLIMNGLNASATEMFAQYPELKTNPHVIQAYKKTNQYDVLLGIYKQLLAKDPSNASNLIGAADTYYHLKNIPKSIEALETIASTSPLYAEQINAAVKLLKQGKNPFDAQ